MVVYRFISLIRKVSSKGNVYGRLVLVDLNGNVVDTVVFDPILSNIEALALNFGEYVDVECNLSGIISVNVSGGSC